MTWDWHDLTAFQGWIIATIVYCIFGLMIWWIERSEAMPYLLIFLGGWIVTSIILWVIDRRV